MMFLPRMYGRLEESRAARATGQQAPVPWYHYIDTVNRDLGFGPVRSFSVSSMLRDRDFLLAAAPTPTAMVSALFGRLAYLVWGTYVFRGPFRGFVGRLLIGRAETVLVNEDTTREEVGSRFKRDCVHVPLFVDSDFFSYAASTKRSDYLFCPGTNDRDLELLESLAAGGLKIKLLHNRPGNEQEQSFHPNIELLSAIPYEQLRQLYQQCRAVINPLRWDRHAAGQTTTLEAVACGAPIVISSGRTSSLFDHLPSVRVFDTCQQWASLEETLKPIGDRQTKAARRWLDDEHLPEARAALERVIMQLEKGAR